MSLFGVDVGDDGLDGFGEPGVGIHFLLHLLDGVEHRGVVPSAELRPGVRQGEVGQAADQVHGDLAGVDTVPVPGLAPDLILLQTEVAADLLDDGVGSDDEAAGPWPGRCRCPPGPGRP